MVAETERGRRLDRHLDDTVDRQRWQPRRTHDEIVGDRDRCDVLTPGVGSRRLGLLDVQRPGRRQDTHAAGVDDVAECGAELDSMIVDRALLDRERTRHPQAVGAQLDITDGNGEDRDRDVQSSRRS